MAELADATDSKSVELTPHAGSIPATGTEEGVVKKLAPFGFFNSLVVISALNKSGAYSHARAPRMNIRSVCFPGTVKETNNAEFFH